MFLYPFHLKLLTLTNNSWIRISYVPTHWKARQPFTEKNFSPPHHSHGACCQPYSHQSDPSVVPRSKLFINPYIWKHYLQSSVCIKTRKRKKKSVRILCLQLQRHMWCEPDAIQESRIMLSGLTLLKSHQQNSRRLSTTTVAWKTKGPTTLRAGALAQHHHRWRRF